jgi:hypothetical protein
MRYELRANAYDALDHVVFTLQVYGPGLEGSLDVERVLWRGESFAGTGESDPAEWARDALVAMLEAL